MTEDLERKIGAIGSEGPSPDFVARLRERIQVESGERMPPAATPAAEIVLGPESENDAPPYVLRWPRLVAAAALLVVVGIVIQVVSGGDDGVEVDSAAEADFVAGAEPLTAENVPLEPGTYRVDTLGTPFSITLDEAHSLQENRRATVVLGHPRSQGGVDRVLTIARLSELVDPASPVVGLDEDAGGWPASDFVGWADAVTDDIVVTDIEQVTLGGREAVRADLELGFNCPVGDGACTALGTTGAGQIPLYQDASYRLWVVDQGSEDPVLVLAGYAREADAAWFDTVETTVSTLAFGAVAPNPVTGTAGTVDSPFLEGIRFALPERSFALRDARFGDEVILEDWPARSTFFAGVLDADGSSLSTPAEVVGVLQAGGSEVTDLGSTAVGGFDARSYDIEGASPEPVLRAAAGDVDGWLAPTRGRLWIIDHPDRGLLMVTAEATDNVDAAFPLALENAQRILDSLEFVDR